MRKALERNEYHLIIAVLVTFAITFIHGCKPIPVTQEVTEIISGHFESRGYNVTQLRIGKISPVEISEKTYMGTPGYKVNISKITLTDKGHKLEFEFNDAVITMRESASSKTRWSIIDIKGINLI